MGKKTARKKKSQHKTPPMWVWAAVAGAILLAGGGLMMLLFGGNNNLPPGFTPEVTGAPALKVDRQQIDEGDIKLGVTKRTVFNLQNVGDKPLKILGQPQVKLVEGC